MQGGKNRIFPKEMNANRFFWDSHLLEIWSNHFFPFMGPYGGSVATDSVSKLMRKCSDIEAQDRNETKTFWCVPKLFSQKGNVSLYFKNFKTKPKRFVVFQNFLKGRYYVFQELKNKTKRFGLFQQILLAKQNFLNVLKNLKTKQIIYL